MALSPEEVQNFARQRLSLQQEHDVNRSRTQQDVGLGTRLLQEASQRGQQEVAEQIGSNGLYHSGIRVNAQGQIVREMNEGIGELQLNSNRNLQDLSSKLAGGLADINFNEQQTIANRGREEAEREARRAELAAQAAAQIVQPPPLPQPVITLPPGTNPFAPPPFDWTGFTGLGGWSGWRNRQAPERNYATGSPGRRLI